MKAWLSNIFFRVIGISFFSLVLSVANAQTPTITSFTPTLGAISATVTITGQNFNATAANNIVFFGGTRAIVQAGSTATSLIVRVPYGANYNYISVTNLATRLTAYSFKPFVVTYNMPLNAFAESVNVGAGTDLIQSQIKDFNNDGKADVIALDKTGQALHIYTNTTVTGSSLITFTSQVLNVGVDIASAVSEDLDGDGRPDLAISDLTGQSIRAYRNVSTPAGAISFTTNDLTLNTSVSSWALAIGNIDMDGRPDIAIADRSGTGVYVYRNASISGSISFSLAISVTTGSANLYALAIGDVDSDGKIDLVTGGTGGNTIVSVLRNTTTGLSGTISFTLVNLPSGGNAYSLALGNLNADSKLDLAVVNNVSSSDLL